MLGVLLAGRRSEPIYWKQAVRWEGSEKNSCQGTVLARLQTGFMQNRSNAATSALELNYSGRWNYWVSNQTFFLLFHHLTNLPKKQVCFGLISKPGYTEDSFFSLCNLYIISPCAYQKGKSMQRMAWKGRPETKRLRLCPGANGGPATQHPSVPELLQK